MYMKYYFILYTSFRKHAYYVIFNAYFFWKFQHNINDICIYIYNYMIFAKTVNK